MVTIQNISCYEMMSSTADMMFCHFIIKVLHRESCSGTGKHPDILVCMLLAQALVFEDAPNGVEGALAAGMQVVWVPDPRCVEALGRTTSGAAPSPTLTILSLLDFEPQAFGLPAFS